MFFKNEKKMFPLFLCQKNMFKKQGFKTKTNNTKRPPHHSFNETDAA